MKIVILVVGICVILLILFLSYFADTRKSTKVSKKEKDVEKSDFEEELEDENYVEDLYSEANEEDIPYEKEENESYETDKVLASDIDETEEYSDEGDDESLFSSISKDEGIVSTFGEDDENDIVAKDIDETKEELESTYTAEIADTTSTTFNTEEIKGIKYEDDTSVDSLVENKYEDSDGSFTNNNSDDMHCSLKWPVRSELSFLILK
jgi:FtsZ-interacting cell division protein ZipA